MELPEEGAFDLAALVVIGTVALQNLVQTLEEKCPELAKGPVISYEIRRVCCVVMVRPYNFWPVQLPEYEVRMSRATTNCDALR